MGSGLIERASAAVEALFDAPENHGAASNEQIAEAVLAVVVDQEAERLREWLTFIEESTEDDNLCAAVELALKGERVELSATEWLEGEAT